MHVIKRDGRRQEVNFDAVLRRIERLCGDLNKTVDPVMIAQKTIDGLHDCVKTTDLDELAAQVCASMATKHPDFSKLASRITCSNIHKETPQSFLEVIEKLHGYIDPKTGRHSPFVSDKLLELAHKHSKLIDKTVDHSRDQDNYDYIGLKTMQKGYLMEIGGRTVERPQHMLMRVSLGIHGEDIDAALETYDYMSRKHFTHATPTMFNAGTPIPQLSSCFLVAMQEDSIPGIYNTLKQCALISQHSGGIGLSVHNVRAKGSFIAGTRGRSDGLVPMIKNFNETARYVNQGGKRKGAFAIYLETHHADIYSFLELKKNHGAEEMRARDLFYGLWISDLFMKRVEEDQNWTLFCPKEAPGLHKVYGKEYVELYERYEKEGRGRQTIKARDLWSKIVESQIETGTPYVLFKDAVNNKSNQKNVGVIRSSNLCTEIVQYSDSKEIATCNLASIAVNSFVKEDGSYDFEELHKVAKIATRNINKVIDVTHYPLEEARRSNIRHRPIGIGIQGLADAFVMSKLMFDEPRARKLNKDIMETIYHGAIEASIELAEKDGPYDSFKGSPASEGVFQFDMWGVIPDSGLWDWEKTRNDMVKHGLRNSLLTAPMPTASTAQILGNTEAFEVPTSNLYVRRVLSGEFIVINKYLLQELIELGLWDENMRHKLMSEKGSVQNIEEIPKDVRDRYRTVWEISQKSLVDMAADRGPFVCQSQSFNVHMQDASASKLTSLHFYAWKKGLKTGMYYLRNTPARDAVAFTVDKTRLQAKKEENISEKEKIVVQSDRDEDPNICISCGS